MAKGSKYEHLHMPDERYKAALVRQRARIEGGLALTYWDDTTPGDKDTQCSWGLCSRDKEAWPDAEDHLWPDDFIDHSRVSPRYMVKGQLCPFDTDKNMKGDAREEGDPMGCFYRCRFFQAHRLGPAPDKKRALELYDARMEEVGAAKRPPQEG